MRLFDAMEWFFDLFHFGAISTFLMKAIVSDGQEQKMESNGFTRGKLVDVTAA